MSKLLLSPRYLIDGVSFRSVHGVFLAAKQMGFDGSERTLAHRLKTRPHIWAEIARPVDTARSKGGYATRKAGDKAIAAAIAAIDARKKEMDL